MSTTTELLAQLQTLVDANPELLVAKRVKMNGKEIEFHKPVHEIILELKRLALRETQSPYVSLRAGNSPDDALTEDEANG